MAEDTRAIIGMIKKTVTGFSVGMMAASMRDSGPMGSSTEKVDIIDILTRP